MLESKLTKVNLNQVACEAMQELINTLSNDDVYTVISISTDKGTLSIGWRQNWKVSSG